MRTAIATGGYWKPGETFVNRHIQHLFGGDTVVVANRLRDGNPYDKPCATRRRARFAAADLWQQPVASLQGMRRWSTTTVPHGRTRRALEAFLRAERVEAILAEFGSEAIALAPVAEGLGLPIFGYFRGYDASKDLRKERVCEAYRRAMPKLAGVFAVSRFLLDNLAAHGIRHPQSFVIPSGVDVRRFVPGEKRPGSFLAVGRLIDKKAPQITLRAFADAARDRPGARLDVAGDGPLLEECRALVDGLGMTGRITLHGALPHDRVRAMLAETEVFLQHSLTDAQGNTEGLPTAIQEAMAAGCAVISTRHAGIPEAVEEGATGWLVAERDEPGFTARIAAALADPGLAAMGARARQVAEARFDNARLLAELEMRMRALAGR
ncbi:glycosyltransferase [Frigidibacter oleivorans]|uniref:glycosyltransferase n=1 Tax=Frigidibacter oleivorans TaxID=2487129 RepID=UPI000F8EC535|nr:glycosyltransferase [Frigidibacter oleivorans]